MRSLLLFLLAFSAQAQDQTYYDPTDQLMAGFSAGCSTSGGVTTEVDTQMATIKSVLTEMNSEKNCRSDLAPLIDQMNSAVGLGTFDRFSAADKKKNIVIDLTMAIQAELAKPAPDATLVSALQSSLAQSKIDMITLQQDATGFKSQARQVDTMRSVVTYSAQLMQGLLSQQGQACRDNNPSLILRIGAQITALSSNFFSGLLGASLLTAGTIVDKYLDYVKQEKLAGRIKAIVENRLGQAIGCAIESVARTYCVARDVENLSKFNIDSQSVPLAQRAALSSINILSNDLPAFQAWAARVKAGSSPTSDGQVIDKRDARQTETDFDGSKDLIVSKLSIMHQELDAHRQDLTLSNQIIKRKIDEISEIMLRTLLFKTNNLGIRGPGPLGTFFNSDECGPRSYLSLPAVGGVIPKSCPNIGSTPCAVCVQSNAGDYVPTENDLISRIDAAMTSAQDVVATDKSRVFEASPELVIGESKAKVNNRSAYDFLISTKNYVVALSQKAPFNEYPTKGQIDELVPKIDHILDLVKYTVSRNIRNVRSTTIECIKEDDCKGLIECKMANGKRSCIKYEVIGEVKVPLTPAEIVDELSKEVAPKGDLAHIGNVLRNLVRIDLQTRLENKEIEKNLALIMQQSVTSGLSELLDLYRDAEMNITRSDEARVRAETNIWILADAFRDAIKANLENNYLRAKAGHRESARLMATECARALMIPDPAIHEALNLDLYCRDVVRCSINTKSDIRLDFNKLEAKPFPERVCSIYDFYRNTQLQSVLGMRENLALGSEEPVQAKKECNPVDAGTKFMDRPPLSKAPPARAKVSEPAREEQRSSEDPIGSFFSKLFSGNGDSNPRDRDSGN